MHLNSAIVPDHACLDNEERMLFYDRMGVNAFEKALSTYDTRRRIQVLVDDFLGSQLRNQRVLDVGCGLGYFSERARFFGADVTSTDISPVMVEATKLRAQSDGCVVDACHLVAKFERESFDIVLSSECIEHTPDPLYTLKQMIAVLKPGGLIAVSTPNRVWQPVVRLATTVKLRKFAGFENFVTWDELRAYLRSENISIINERGLHLFPFQMGLHRISTWCDVHLQGLRGAMINICVLGRKNSKGQV